MLNKKTGLKISSLILFCTLSLLSGGVNGFLGTGGGIIFIYMLQALTKNNIKDNFSTSLCATIPISFIALLSYAKTDSVDFSLIQKIIIPTVSGGIIGAFLTDKLKTNYLSVIFGALVTYCGIRMITR